MKPQNLTKCDKCNLMLMSEETMTHECLVITDYFVIGSLIWVCDGHNYYPLKLRSTESLRKKNQPQN